MALEDKKFDPHLAQAENLSALFVALNDEVFEIRELAMCTIGRLSSRNPAYVMPSLRKVLIQVTKCAHTSVDIERIFLVFVHVILLSNCVCTGAMVCVHVRTFM